MTRNSVAGAEAGRWSRRHRRTRVRPAMPRWWQNRGIAAVQFLWPKPAFARLCPSHRSHANTRTFSGDVALACRKPIATAIIGRKKPAPIWGRREGSTFHASNTRQRRTPLNHLRVTWYGHHRRGRRGVPGILLGRQVDLRVERFLPGEHFARVGAHAPEDRGHRA